MNNLPENIAAIVRTLVQILRDRGENLPVKILSNANLDIRETNYDNWNGGTYGYTLDLQVPIDLYARIQDNLETIETDLLKKLKPLIRSYENEYLEKVIIAPKYIEDSDEDEKVDVEDTSHIKTISFWEQGYFRLFLSHISQHKETASQLQIKLKKYAISTFVAHEDIEPTKEWLDEIELALSSMDALAALLTERFNESKWSDQEVGIAIGRKIIVIPIRAGIDPYGFIGKYQGLSAHNKDIETLCKDIFNILLLNNATKLKMTNAIVNKLCNSKNFAESKDTTELLNTASINLNPDMIKKLLSATKNNRQVYDSFGVVDRLNSLIRVASEKG